MFREFPGTEKVQFYAKTRNRSTTSSGHLLCIGLVLPAPRSHPQPLKGGKHQKVLKSMSKRHLGRGFVMAPLKIKKSKTWIKVIAVGTKHIHIICTDIYIYKYMEYLLAIYIYISIICSIYIYIHIFATCLHIQELWQSAFVRFSEDKTQHAFLSPWEGHLFPSRLNWNHDLCKKYCVLHECTCTHT